MFGRKQQRSRRGDGEQTVQALSEVDASQLYSRNWAYVTPKEQAALSEQVLFAAGVGLSSVVVTLACRTGFTRFILADGDTVELSNLNRQAFGQGDLGHNKAEAAAALLRAIRPDVSVEIVPRFITDESFGEYLDRATIVVNSIDFDNPALFALNREAQRRGIPVLSPLNLGWGGAVFVFTSRSPSLEAFLDLPPEAPSAADVQRRLVARVFADRPGGVPSYLAELFQDFMGGEGEWPCDPQLGVAASVTSAMVVQAACALATGRSVRTVPDVNYCDVRTLMEVGSPSPAASVAEGLERAAPTEADPETIVTEQSQV